MPPLQKRQLRPQSLSNLPYQLTERPGFATSHDSKERSWLLRTWSLGAESAEFCTLHRNACFLFDEPPTPDELICRAVNCLSPMSTAFYSPRVFTPAPEDVLRPDTLQMSTPALSASSSTTVLTDEEGSLPTTPTYTSPTSASSTAVSPTYNPRSSTWSQESSGSKHQLRRKSTPRGTNLRALRKRFSDEELQREMQRDVLLYVRGQLPRTRPSTARTW
ncbi:hypothetical protein BT63DRAFT_460169 [Microthyrium microscopicum]|uniref:Uncharacterized protein n=1 Tax=Microthyrium microscopicum TaxID=703497 RepID=A0A6A6TZ26_9PEZI|nr:hypothetical protein BT63DRAFT_460169 [Microthyrium microscopicum]